MASRRARRGRGVRRAGCPSVPRSELEGFLQPSVAPEHFRADGEGRRTENAKLAGGIGRLLQQLLAFRTLCADDDRCGWFAERGQHALDVIADARRATADEPVVKGRARIVLAPFLLR